MKNYTETNKLAKEFKELTNIDYTSDSRKVYDVYIRALFYKVLEEKGSMLDREISEWFMEEHNTTRNRSSIYHALSKIDLYYQNYKEFRNLYDTYFDDKIEERREQEVKEKRIIAKKRASKPFSNKNNVLPIQRKRNALKDIIDVLPANRLEEIEELLKLRIKSWSWKAKNEYEIIEGSESISAFTF